MNAWLALAAMETRGYFRSKAALFWTFAYPVLLLVILATLFARGPAQVVVEVADSDDVATLLTGLERKVALLSGLALDVRKVEAARPVHRGVVRLSVERVAHGASTVIASFRPPLTAETGGALALVAETVETMNVEGNGGARTWQIAYRPTPAGGADGGESIRYLITGMAALTIVSTALFGFTGVLVELRARGALIPLQLMPIGRLQFLTAFAASRIVILLAFTVAFVLAANWIYDAGLATSAAAITWMSLVTLTGSLAFLGVGLLVAAIVTKTATAQALINIINIPIIFLSDLFVPVAVMPQWLQHIVAWSPTNGFVNALRGTLEGGFHIAEAAGALAALASMAAVGFGAASALFKWRA